MALYRLEGEAGTPIRWTDQQPGDLILSLVMAAVGDRTRPIAALWRVAQPGQGRVKIDTPEGDVDASAHVKMSSAAEWERLFPLQGLAPTVRTPAEAEAHLKELHEHMGAGGNANQLGQARAAGLLTGFVLCGLLTEREAKIWRDRLLECPDDGLHGGGQSWCNYCDDVCRDCGEPIRRGSHPSRHCVCKK